ncbi:MAG: type II toxin-antitoxin system VapC family toxin [Geminicoccaceae bacterium]
MNGTVLDTNLVSEQRRVRPHSNVVAWFARELPDCLFLTATVVGELAVGIACLPAGKRRSDMEAWLNVLISERFAGRILPFDGDAALTYGGIVARARAQGRSPNISDAQIAAVARLHDMAVATCHIADFEPLGVAIVNPWEAG